ncbi:hypothetical protein SISNIDRAFT_471487 [Sistotremastrum niveocremeum HHB9708]|uniref:Uncharacterized protein n=1 Tax=Sistotremastrum niveocremeum HHB9708 TaxID=1314777 RepID=A0A164ML87_9AGAM|nr:hypothetical protein SISNIDRAFT_471487 [Sistotremastrum niveocremeum HHB9708]
MSLLVLLFGHQGWEDLSSAPPGLGQASPFPLRLPETVRSSEVACRRVMRRGENEFRSFIAFWDAVRVLDRASLINSRLRGPRLISSHLGCEFVCGSIIFLSAKEAQADELHSLRCLCKGAELTVVVIPTSIMVTIRSESPVTMRQIEWLVAIAAGSYVTPIILDDFA